MSDIQTLFSDVEKAYKERSIKFVDKFKGRLTVEKNKLVRAHGPLKKAVEKKTAIVKLAEGKLVKYKQNLATAITKEQEHLAKIAECDSPRLLDITLKLGTWVEEGAAPKPETPIYIIPDDCYSEVKANCEEMLKSGITARIISEILSHWWFYEGSSEIYSDCIYALYQFTMPERALDFKEGNTLGIQLAQFINTGAK